MSWSVAGYWPFGQRPRIVQDSRKDPRKDPRKSSSPSAACSLLCVFLRAGQARRALICAIGFAFAVEAILQG